MTIHRIRNKADSKRGLREVSAFFDNEPEPGSEDGDRSEILLTLLEAFEAKHFRIHTPDPIEAIRIRMQQGGVNVKELVPSIAQPNHV